MSAAAVDRIDLKSTWAVFAKPSGDLAQQRVALRVMASIVRAMRQTNTEGGCAMYQNSFFVRLQPFMLCDYNAEVRTLWMA